MFTRRFVDVILYCTCRHFEFMYEIVDCIWVHSINSYHFSKLLTKIKMFHKYLYGLCFFLVLKPSFAQEMSSKFETKRFSVFELGLLEFKTFYLNDLNIFSPKQCVFICTKYDTCKRFYVGDKINTCIFGFIGVFNGFENGNDVTPAVGQVMKAKIGWGHKFYLILSDILRYFTRQYK